MAGEDDRLYRHAWIIVGTVLGLALLGLGLWQSFRSGGGLGLGRDIAGGGAALVAMVLIYLATTWMLRRRGSPVPADDAGPRWLNVAFGLVTWALTAGVFYVLAAERRWIALAISGAAALFFAGGSWLQGLRWPRIGIEILITAVVASELIDWAQGQSLGSIALKAVIWAAVIALFVFLAWRAEGHWRRLAKQNRSS